MIIRIMEITATVLTLIGVPFIAIPKIHGLYFMLFAQVLWIFVAFSNELYFLTSQSLFLLAFNFYGIYSWRKKGVGK